MTIATMFLVAASIIAAPFGHWTAASMKTEARGDAEVRVEKTSLPKGIEKRLENGKILPKGFLKNALSVVVEDTVAPEVRFEAATRVTADSARVVWVTDEPSDIRVWVSTSSSVDTNASPSEASAELSSFHSIELDDLTENTTYFYVIASRDASGNEVLLTANSFTTLE